MIGKIERSSARYGESGYARLQDDLYETPTWATDGVLKLLPLRGAVWEPAAGSGAMVASLRDAGYDVVATDLVARSGLNFTGDFLSLGALPKVWRKPAWCRTVFTNPPYDFATEFVRHALNLVEPVGGMVVMLLRREWDCAPTRCDLYAKLSSKWTLTRRIRWIPGSKGSPREHHAFFVWNFADLGARRMEWI